MSSLRSSGHGHQIGELDQYPIAIPADTPGRMVVQQLEHNPHLPGVIIVSTEPGSPYLGMISRQKCFEQLGRPFGVDVYLNRPILMLYNMLHLTPMLLPANTLVEEAVRICLNRPAGETYEPIVVQHQLNQYSLLDFQTLLMAEARLLGEANRLVHQQIEIGQAISSTLELEDVLDLILRFLEELVPYHRAGVLLEQDGCLNVVAQRGFDKRVGQDTIRINLEESQIYRQLCETSQPLSIADVTTQPAWKHFEPLEKTRSWAGIPLLFRRKPLGMISLARLKIQPFTASELELAQSFARQAAVALNNAHLYHKVKHFNKELEETVRQRTNQLQTAYSQLETLDRAKSDFINVVSHELRTPLTVVGGYIQMLAAHPVIKADEQLQPILTGTMNGLKRQQEIVNSMLDVARIDNNQLNLRMSSIQLDCFIAELRHEFVPKAAERNLRLEIADFSDLPNIVGDCDALRKVFQHLLYNAIKYTPDGGCIRLWRQLVGHNDDSQQSTIDIVVQDTGIGIAPEHRDLIFAKFFVTGKVSLHSSGKTKFKGGGTGLGLAIAQGIVEAHGGRIWVESPGYDEASLPGSQFHVLLPLAYHMD
jgi:signal transduction histidine kinase